MSRNYGSLGQRRSSGAAWQWMIIGVVLGFFCSAIIVVVGIIAGVLNVDGIGVAARPTSTPLIITATPLPATPTFTPTPITPSPTLNMELQVQLPSATPTTNPASLLPSPSPTTALPSLPTGGNTLTGGATQQTVVGAQQPAGAGSAAVGDRLLAIASELVSIPGGTFTMGTDAAEVIRAVNLCLEGYGGQPGACQPEYGEDSAPPHSVTISPFLMEEGEVSYEQYLTFMNQLGPGSHRNGCNGQPCMQTRTESETSNVTFDSANYSVLPGILNHPMTNVTWYGAQAYCEALGRRLPTEAEWERAARGDTGFVYPWGNDWDGSRANTNRPADPATPLGKFPVDAFPTGRSSTGVLNMAGNVAEWVSDWYDPVWYSNPSSGGADPRGPAGGTERVVRGGSWDAVPFFSRTVHRQSRDPLSPTAWIGFRCAADQGAQQTTGANTGIGGTTAQQPALPGTTLTPVPPAGGSEEETTANSQPTLRPAATTAPLTTNTPASSAPATQATLAP